MTRKIRLSTNLNKDIISKLDELSKRKNMSRSAIVEYAIIEKMDSLKEIKKMEENKGNPTAFTLDKEVVQRLREFSQLTGIKQSRVIELSLLEVFKKYFI